jgi:negative regulator of flagellin synthesis FlgM
MNITDASKIGTTGPGSSPAREQNVELGTSGDAAQRLSPPTGTSTLEVSDTVAQVISDAEFDATKVEELRQAIQAGNYPLDPRRIAESFLVIEELI